MTDPYANIRKALATYDTYVANGQEAKGRILLFNAMEEACDPDTIRALVEDRDADRKRLAFLSKEPVVEGFVGITKDVYDYACDCAEEGGREEPDDEDMLNGMRRLIDAAIAAANGGGNG